MDSLSRRQAVSVLTYLKGKGSARNALLWALGITTGLRISDLLNRRWVDFLDADGRLTDSITVKETKTRKVRTIAILGAARDALQAYDQAYHPAPTDPVFSGPTGKAITREQARRLVKRWCAECNLDGHFGTHTMRKVFCSAAYDNSGGDPVATARVTGHSNPSQLLHYVGRSAATDRQILAGIDKAFGGAS